MRDDDADTQRGIYSAMTIAQVGFPQRLGARLKICALAICAGSLLIGQPAKAQSVPLPILAKRRRSRWQITPSHGYGNVRTAK